MTSLSCLAALSTSMVIPRERGVHGHAPAHAERRGSRHGEVELAMRPRVEVVRDRLHDVVEQRGDALVVEPAARLEVGEQHDAEQRDRFQERAQHLAHEVKGVLALLDIGVRERDRRQSQAVHDLLDRVHDGCREQLVLRLEVLVDQRDVDAGLVGDVAHAGAGAEGQEHPSSRFEDLHPAVVLRESRARCHHDAGLS